jgi:cytochrome c oxidase subunit 3
MTAYAARRAGLPAGWWGMLMLIASETTLLACLIATYWYLRIRAVHWPPAGIPEPRVVVPMALAGVLLLTSIPMRLAASAAREGRLGATRLLVLLAFVVQTGYLAYEINDFGDQLRVFGVARNAYSSIYYTLLGADHAHVAVGLLLDIWLLAKLARGLTAYRVNAAVAIAWYWHFVNLLTVVVIGTLTSVNVI